MKKKWGTYRDILEIGEAGVMLKKREDIKEWITEWFQSEMYKKDKLEGSAEQSSDFERGLMENNEKLILKMYKILLEWETKAELLKAAMIHWARDVGHNIKRASWEKLWVINMTFAACYTLRENYLKIIYRWYLIPSKLAKMCKKRF